MFGKHGRKALIPLARLAMITVKVTGVLWFGAVHEDDGVNNMHCIVRNTIPVVKRNKTLGNFHFTLMETMSRDPTPELSVRLGPPRSPGC